MRRPQIQINFYTTRCLIVSNEMGMCDRTNEQIYVLLLKWGLSYTHLINSVRLVLFQEIDLHNFGYDKNLFKTKIPSLKLSR